MDKKLRNSRQKHLLWVDLEMTSLDPIKDRIMEVAAIVTDWDFNEIATYEGVVKVSSRLADRQMNTPFWDTFPEVRSALKKQNVEKGKPSRTIENELLAFIDVHFEKDIPVILAGNSIHMDRRFIINEWKKFDARLHYRMLDVSAWKVVFDGKYGKKFAKPEEHRALDDIRGSIMELKYYLAKVKI
ncbi:MAG: oligoribonuclease [Candidatus Saccharimonadales bacterium]